ncbi:probable galacturonosyltransferase 7 isoform X2 [Ananas comosus]|uniref:Hexosyltransferase n=1 Tax=Ananas comosus TaxID=4615 RepID=A0A6P5GLT5_ANACO|nr:probable galacturonosyltransferase 7 isoform X2 [Ananas comosus]
MKAPMASVKRRWRGPSVAVLALVFCSLLVPLAFLFGRFPSGYGTDERPQQEVGFHSFGQAERVKKSPVDQQPNVEKIMEKFRPTLPKGVMEKDVVQARGHLLEKPAIDSSHNDAISNSQPKVPLPPQIATPKPLEPPDRSNGGNIHKKQAKDLKGDEVEKSCQLEFGSYCLWSVEHKEVMKDSTVKRLKDQLFVARAYYPSIAKLRGQENLTRELKQSIQDHERVLSVAIVDADLPPLIEKKVKNMEQTIARAKSCSVDCNNIDKKLRQILYLTEDETHFHMKQSAFLYRLGVQTMPKSLHCLSMRLTVEYFRSPPADSEHLHAHKFDTPKYRHYIIFSRNILAASVAINSTVMSSEVTGNMVFHLLTDAQNYYAMKLWCSRHSYKEAVLRVINFESLVLKKLHNVAPQKLFLSEEFRVSIHNMDQPTAKMRTEYLSVFSHSHFFLPEIFKNLQKVVILDDDVVVQRDLSPLWNLDLGNKVNGAAKFCGVRLRQLRRYLGKNIYDADSCAWMSGLNIIDLENWRKNNITEKYLLLLEQFQGNSEASLQASAFPISLLAFQNLIYPLDNKWTLSGFGYDYGLEADDARNAVSLHYNGNMKPWLDLGIPEYKKYWKKFLTRGERFMDECNAHP